MTAARRQSWTACLSHRSWLLCGLLITLSVLAVLQYRWINEVAQAQRERTQANLTSALSSVESDFDVEITRAIETFQLPLAHASYAERYNEWLRHAPYPNLIRGVYTIETNNGDNPPKPVAPGEPPIRSVEWRQNPPRASFGGVTASVAVPAAIQVFSTGAGVGTFFSSGPQVTVDGNPAFAFPLMLSAARVAGRMLVRPPEKEPFEETEIIRSAGAIGPPEWVVVVFDAGYIRRTFLPAIVRRYFQSPMSSDFDLIVVDRNRTSSSVVFPAQSQPLPAGFAKPDESVELFELRPDCFSVSSSPAPATPSAAALTNLPSIDSVSEILARKPTTCAVSVPPIASNPDQSWELLAKYREGSLDQAMATLRRRNLILSGTVLLVLAIGVSMAVLLTERARALAEMQAEFILGMSHELRTPLTVIRVAADNLKKGMVANPEQAHRYGEIIHTQAAELSNMVEETLTLARIRSDVAGHRSQVRPEQIVKDVLTSNEDALVRAGMKVEVEVGLGLQPISADSHLIARCVGNLVQNAIKYASAGKRILIRARHAIRHDQQVVEISVEDHGPGISAEDLPHIFEPFYRGKTADTSRISGIGLGLTLVKRAVEAHDGSVEVRSAETTRFSIFLPSQNVEPNGHKAV